jgi:hypothetical protein
MASVNLQLRAASLLGIGALGVHELRYLLGYGGEAGSALAAHGHAYLAPVGGLVALVSIVALSRFLARLARGEGHEGESSCSTRQLALGASAALLAIYVGQELIEGLLAPGHPGGFAGVIGTGGWTAVPLACLFGVVTAALLRCADAVLSRGAARRPRLLPRPSRVPAIRPPLRAPGCALAGLARNIAGRAPPPAAVAQTP